MSLILFSEDKKSAINHFIILVLAILLTPIGLVFVNSDILTSAKFYDGLGLQPVITAAHTNGVSREGWLFGFALCLVQIYLGYKTATEQSQSRIRYYWIAYLLAASFDTYTDSDFRSWGFNNLYLAGKSLMVSLFVYNIFSEWAVGTGAKEIVRNLWSAPIVLSEIGTEYKRRTQVKKDDKPKGNLPPIRKPQFSDPRRDGNRRPDIQIPNPRGEGRPPMAD